MLTYVLKAYTNLVSLNYVIIGITKKVTKTDLSCTQLFRIFYTLLRHASVIFVWIISKEECYKFHNKIYISQVRTKQNAD